MIQKNGHYIVDVLFGLGTDYWCLKCHEEYSSRRGRATTAEISEAFEKACRGNWSKTLRNVEWKMTQLTKEIARVRKWMAHDQKGRKTARSTQGGSPAPISQQNAANRRP